MADALILPEAYDELPRIAWNNLAAGATLSASSAATGHAAAYAVDGRLDRTWRPTAGGTQWLIADWGSLQTVDCWCLYAHDLGAQGATVQLQLWDGSSWYAHGDAIMPAGSAAIYQRVDAVASSQARLMITGAAAACRLGAWFVGQDRELPRGCQPGFVDPQLGRRREYQAARGRDGTPLPGIVRDETCELALDLMDVPEAWARSSWLSFQQARDGAGLFWLRWRADVPAACCSQAQFRATAYSRPGFVRCGLTCRADTQ